MKTFTGLCWGLTITFMLAAAINFASSAVTTALIQSVG